MSEQHAGVSQGPPRPPVDREEAVRKVKAALWSAVWEASKFLSYDEIRGVVEGTIDEIVSDEV